MKASPLAAAAVFCLAVSASRAAVYTYAEYHLGEAGSLTAPYQMPQDSSGYGRSFAGPFRSTDQTVVSASTSTAAIGSTASLDTGAAGDQGWDQRLTKAPDYIDIPTDNFAFGIFALARSAPASGVCNIFSLGQFSSNLGLTVNSSGWALRQLTHDQFYYSYPATLLAADPGSFVPNTWAHLAVIRSGGVTRLYVNGVQQSAQISGASAASAEAAIAGIYPDTMGSDFNGLLDEARIVTFTPGETTANILAALQSGAVPTAFVKVGKSAIVRKASLSPAEPSVFRIGGAIQDFVTVVDPGGLEVAGTAPQKHLIQIVKEGPVAAGHYPLIGFSGSIGGQGLDGLQVAPVAGRFTATLEANAATSTIDLVLTGSDGISWSGATSGVWDTLGAANWVLDGTSTPAQFLDADDVIFDDSAATRTVTLAATVSPTLVTVNGSGNYSFTGADIGGSALLKKNGTGTLTLTNENTSTGAITINDGTLSVGDGGTTGSLGSGPITVNGGNLTINRSGSDVTMPNLLSGAGSLTKLGTGRLILGTPGLNISSAFTGPITISQGEIVSASPSCLGWRTASTTIAAGASFDIAGFGAPDEPFTVIGDGDDGQGVIKNSGASNLTAVTDGITLAGDVSLGGTGNWGRANLGGNFKVSKIGTNQINVGIVSVKDIDVKSGTLCLQNSGTGFGSSVNNTYPGTITINGGTLLAMGAYKSCVKPIVFNSGKIAGGYGNLDSSITLASNTTFDTTRGDLTVGGTISGPGDLIKEGQGWLMMGNGTYTGNTIVNKGTLEVYNEGLADASTLSLAHGASLYIQFRGTDLVHKLILEGFEQPAGLYSFRNRPDFFPANDSYTGYVLVTDGYEDHLYDLWEQINGISGSGPNADPDNDGYTNAMEFMMGTYPTSSDVHNVNLPPKPVFTPADSESPGSVYFTYYVTHIAEKSVTAEYRTSMSGDWISAVDGVDGVRITKALYGSDRDIVKVRIPLGGASGIMGRLRIDTP